MKKLLVAGFVAMLVCGALVQAEELRNIPKKPAIKPSSEVSPLSARIHHVALLLCFKKRLQAITACANKEICQ